MQGGGRGGQRANRVQDWFGYGTKIVTAADIFRIKPDPDLSPTRTQSCLNIKKAD